MRNCVFSDANARCAENGTNGRVIESCRWRKDRKKLFKELVKEVLNGNPRLREDG